MRFPRAQVTVRRAAVVAFFAVALWWYDTSAVTVREGDFPLTINVVSTSHAPIQDVSCQAFPRESDASTAAERGLPPEATDWRTSADPFTGEPLSLELPFTARVSAFGRTLHEFQHRALAVVVTLRDGRRVTKVVAIPHRDSAHSVTVTLP